LSTYETAQLQLDESLAIIPSRAHKKVLFSEAMLCLIACGLPQSIISDYMESQMWTLSTIPQEKMAQIFEQCLNTLETAINEYDSQIEMGWSDWITERKNRKWKTDIIK